VDAAGNVYAAVQNAVFAWNPAGARLFDLSVSQDPTNLKFGGASGRTLFITGGTSLFSVDLNVPVPAQGDYDGNGVVDAGDYVVWRNTLGTTANLSADGNGNRVIDAGDYDVWRSHFGQAIGSGTSASSAAVPEPGLVGILWSACAAGMFARRRGAELFDRDGSSADPVCAAAGDELIGAEHRAADCGQERKQRAEERPPGRDLQALPIVV
jgi:hypothetical protein